MSLNQLIRQHAVIVNTGSGVLFNGMTDQYSYVLTAKHVLSLNNIVTDINGLNLEINRHFVHPDKDCAIILIKYQASSQSGYTDISSIDHPASIVFAGFPEVRRQVQEKYKLFDGHFTDRNADEFVVTLDGIPNKNIIAGMSGGGVYHTHNGHASLVGIEFSMDGAIPDEFPGRVKGHSLKPYLEIINDYGLAPLVPLHLECFSRFIDQIFDFNVIDVNKTARLKEKLLEIPLTWIKSGQLPSPYSLMVSYSHKLLLDGEPTKSLNNLRLWAAYLEFLVICSVIDGVSYVDTQYIARLDRKRRIIYSSAQQNWLRSLKPILKFAKENLDANGAVVISSPQSNPDAFPPNDILNTIIDDISTVPNYDPIHRIDSVAENIYTTFKISHLDALHHECVVANEDTYGSTNKVSEQITFFRSKYHEFFN